MTSTRSASGRAKKHKTFVIVPGTVCKFDQGQIDQVNKIAKRSKATKASVRNLLQYYIPFYRTQNETGEFTICILQHKTSSAIHVGVTKRNPTDERDDGRAYNIALSRAVRAYLRDLK